MTTNTTPPTGQISSSDKETWEYMHHQVTSGQFAKEIHTINAFGREGWELVSGVPITVGGGTGAVLLLFKRRLR